MACISVPSASRLAFIALCAAPLFGGCSFPTSDFHLLGEDATVTDARTPVDVPAVDAQGVDTATLDTPVMDVAVDAGTDAVTVDAPADAMLSDASDAASADAPADVVLPVDASCPAGQTICAGACVDTNADVTNCGVCGVRCSAANASPLCSAGACSFRCNTGFADCNANAADGCEADLSLATTCGSCTNACSTANGTAGCAAGACTVACNPGWGNCDGNVANGCETDLNTNAAQCGACGRACASTNGTATCAAGMCGITCGAGFRDCDGMVANGCEAAVATDPMNCGACARLCPSGQSCVAGVCTAVCAAPNMMCASGCVDTASDVANCGMCGRACPAVANAAPRCLASACGLGACNTGFGNCDANAANGCEANTNNDINNCGSCGHRCLFANGAAVCTNGACALGACAAGWANCDGNPANGCEANLQTDVANCGACSSACAPANGSGACAAGVCTVARCNAGFSNCDGLTPNGCEINTAADILNCGACGTQCRAGLGGSNNCVSGACTPACTATFANCDGDVTNGCEASIASNANCGACGRVCSGTTPSCSATGVCVAGSPGSAVITRPTIVPAFVEICGAAVPHTTYMPNQDDANAQVPLPFAFRYWNATYASGSMVNLCSNGWLSLNGVATTVLYGSLPDPNQPNGTIAPYFTDLVLSATGVCVATLGVAPSRRFVVEWPQAVLFSDRSRVVTFEVILNEAAQTVELNYDTMAAPPALQNIAAGIENPAGNAAVTLCNPSASCGVTTGGRYSFATAP